MSDTEDLPSILLVSASRFTSKSFERLLSDQFTVIVAESSEQAWDILQQESSITVLVCELVQAADELGLLERIRRAEDKTLASLPVLLLVAESDTEESCDQAFSVGATDFINMPFSSLELRTRVRLHSKLYSLHQKNSAFELASQNSSVDSLNTLMQEKYFLNRLEQEISFSARHKTFVSLCLLRVDDARSIEEKYSKKILRAVLRAVAKIIEEMMRREDVHAYLGDETFALLYPVTNGLGANVTTKRLVERLQQAHLKHEDIDIAVNLSVGLYSTLPSDELTADRAMAVVEQRLAKAQKQGGAQIVSSKAEVENNKISIEQALNMINFKHADTLVKHIPDLVGSLLPLLEYIQQNNEMEFNRILDNIDDDS